MADTTTRIRPRERDAVIQSLRAGVVPRVGQAHIQVGRAAEVQALVHDLDRIADGGSGSRFVIGEYGAGKTFFLNLIRSIALEKRLVTVHADLSPDRRLQSTSGHARGALPSLVERFVSQATTEARDSGAPVDSVIRTRLGALREMTGGYDFADVVAKYWQGHDTGDEQLQADAVRWLRGEFATRTDARAALGVRTIVDDAGFYDQLKIMSRFVTFAGYRGLLVCLDELVNLYKIVNTQARNANYEQVLGLRVALPRLCDGQRRDRGRVRRADRCAGVETAGGRAHAVDGPLRADQHRALAAVDGRSSLHPDDGRTLRTWGCRRSSCHCHIGELTGSRARVWPEALDPPGVT